MTSVRFSSLQGWILPALILALWEALSRVGFITVNVLPAPSQVFTAFWTLLRSGELIANIGISTWRVLAGFAIGGSIGFALGFANGLSNLSRDLTDTMLQMIRNVSHLALIPWSSCGSALTDIPQVAFCLRSKVPDLASLSRFFDQR